MDEGSLRLAKDFAELAVQLRAESRERPTLDRVVTLAVQAIDTCDYCGITLRTPNGTLTTPACSSPLAAQAADLQHQLGEGPCLEAAWELHTITVSNLARDTRWPSWAPTAAALGLSSVWSLRLQINRPLTASLNLFARSVAAFDPTDLAIALRTAPPLFPDLQHQTASPCRTLGRSWRHRCIGVS